jgi:membrane protein
MAFMLAFLRVPLSWAEILKRTFNEAFVKDNCLGMAAQLAYYFFFALFPALLFLVALASYFPIDTLVDDIFERLGRFAPPEALAIITDQITKISEGEEGGLLTAGMLITIWSSSAAMTAIIDTLNASYGIPEGRPWWKVRLTAIGLTIGVSTFILISFALIIVGPTLAERVAEWMYLGAAFEWAWKILQWPVVFVLASVGIALVYYFAPDADQDWVWLTPGSILATTLWLGASLGLKYYVANLGSYTETYGVIGGFMVLLLWFYVSGLVILIGAEMNAEIEHASPYGKEEGEKVPGEKRKIGPARMRAWMRAHGKRRHVPSANDVKDAVTAPSRPAGRPAPGNWPPARVIAMQQEAPRRQLPAGCRFSEMAIGLGVMAAQVYWAARASKRKTRA